MKLTIILIIAAVMQVSASSYAQQITLNVKKAPLEKVLKEIRAQSGYDFLFDAKLIQNAKPVDIQLENAGIEEALKNCLKGQALSYTIDEHTVVIREAEKTLLDKVVDMVADIKDKAGKLVQPSIVVGKVSGSYGVPLSGATVMVKRTKLGTNTDIKGNYILKTAETTDTLVISFIGYKTTTVPINKRVIVDVNLQEATSGLDEVVVQAYGRTTQRLTTGNINRITAADIAKQPVTDPLLALEGRAPGVEITPQTGYDGGPVKVVIRGRQSINTNINSDPLYIIDGVPQTVLDLRPFDYKNNNRQRGQYSVGLGDPTVGYSSGSSPLAAYNPSDIESVEILKDADATAIYGSRGANGVILITTKKGSPSNGDFSIDLAQGVRYTVAEWQQLNTPQYIAMRKEAFRNDGITPTAQNAADIFLLDNNRFTDWQKYAYGNTGNWTNLQASLSGGTAQTTYRLAGGYRASSDISTAKGRNPQGSFSSNLTTHSANQRFTLSFTTNYTFLVNNQISIAPVATLPPNAPSVYDAQGSLNFAEYDKVRISFPFSGLLQPYEGKTNTLNGSLNLNYTIFKGLVAKVNLGYNNTQKQQSQYQPLAAQDPLPGSPQKGSARVENAHTNNIIVEPQLEYNAVIGKGAINLLTGGTYQLNNTSSLQTIGTGYTTDDLLYSMAAAPVVQATDAKGQYKYAGVFARINYNWENKYILNLNGRRDGSSRFGENNRFGNFGSVGAAYIVTEEKWVRDFLPKVFSTIKLRGSYGTTGSDGVGDYQYLTQWAPVSAGQSATSTNPKYNGVIPLVSIQHANTDFHWQVNKKLEGALDLSFLDERISVEVAYYRDRCNNQLIQFPTADLTGFSTVTANSPANVQNDGWEFQANAQIINGKSFHWSASFNIGINKNKLLSYPNFQLSPYYTLMKIGRPLGEQYLYKFTGVDPLTGQYTYLDANHDGLVSAVAGVPPGTGMDDRVALINTTPQYSGGMGQRFSFKNLSLSLFFNYRKQLARNELASTAFGALGNVSLYKYNNRWQNPGDITSIARLTTTAKVSDINYTSSDAAYTDGSFIRLQNIALSYTLPVKIIRKIGLKALAINASAQNIFVITNYKGLDPEVNNFGSMPPTRTITWGLSASF
ncbi:SusC/RagA family TonB-linked outer membrane protein [Mucilaginibacter sp.]|uniref:SusC/RagA family TonB-linked outer membrane protein n=1 Tax=Mucilaginibacter sp. TaxID=1882438 RepID=UPI002ED4D068